MIKSTQVVEVKKQITKKIRNLLSRLWTKNLMEIYNEDVVNEKILKFV